MKHLVFLVALIFAVPVHSQEITDAQADLVIGAATLANLCGRKLTEKQQALFGYILMKKFGDNSEAVKSRRYSFESRYRRENKRTQQKMCNTADDFIDNVIGH